MMSEEEVVLGSSGTRLEELDTGTMHEGTQAAPKGYAYEHWTIRLLRDLIRDVIGHVRCTGMKDTLCLDLLAVEALVSTLSPYDTFRRPESEYLAYTSPPGTDLGHQFTGTPANHALDCNYSSPT
jgi:hypothetical protein